MAAKDTTTLGGVEQRRQVVIPQRICDELELAVGDIVAIERRAGSVVIRPRKAGDRDDVLTAREAASVRRGLAEASSGGVTDWRQYRNRRAMGRQAG